jgi:hypothetical protein
MGQVGPPLSPPEFDKPSKDLKDRDFALYVDGNRVALSGFHLKEDDDGIGITVAFQTSKNALDSPTADPENEIAWGGHKVGNSVKLYQPDVKNMPMNGYGLIHSIRKPKKAGEEAMFVIHASVPIYDYVIEASICEGGEYALIPASWVR